MRFYIPILWSQKYRRRVKCGVLEYLYLALHGQLETPDLKESTYSTIYKCEDGNFDIVLNRTVQYIPTSSNRNKNPENKVKVN